MKWSHGTKVPDEFLQWADEAAEFRHDIHAHPELGFNTTRTAGKIVEALKAIGADEIDDQMVKGGVIAVVNGCRPGAAIALRADNDALAMPDETGLPWASRTPKCHHGCGHDGHTAWLLLALKHLASHRDFPGRVVAIFQPAEEIGSGARAVVAAGVFEKYGIDEVYGAHNDSSLPAGKFGFRAGPTQASCDFFYIRLQGKGIHASRPHCGIDPLPGAAMLIASLQTIVSRRLDSFQPAVVSVSSMQSGQYEAPNVIPNDLKMSGTVRTYDEAVRSQIEADMARMVEHVAAAHELKGELRYDRLTSVVVNDPACVEAASALASEMFGADCLAEQKMTAGGEDFSEYQKKAPGLMFRVGQSDENHRAFGHNPKYDFNDAVLPSAAAFFAALARKRLDVLSN